MPRHTSPAYQLFILGFSLYAILALALGSFGTLDPEVERILDTADLVVCAVFFVDFLLSLWTAERRGRYMVTWGWLDLLSCIPLVDTFRWARLGRLVRLARAIRAVRLIMSAAIERRAHSAFLALALVAFLAVVVASIAILYFEGGTNSRIVNGGDALWWAYVTVTTVGYGDYVPVSVGGRLVAAALMTIGIGIFGTFSGFIAAWFVGERREAKVLEAIEEAVAIAQQPDREG